MAYHSHLARLLMHRTEGIILNTLSFKEYDQILTVFTKDEGLIKLIFKGALGRRRGKGGLTAPLTQAEFVYTKHQSDLYMCREVSVLSHHLRLRDNLAKLEGACSLAHALMSSQLPSKPSPELYRLFVGYLEKICTGDNPQALSSSFFLKIMRHDGLYGITDRCCTCGSALQKLFIDCGESYCESHAPKLGLALNLEEYYALNLLAFSRSYTELCSWQAEGKLSTKIKKMFTEQYAG